MIADSAIRPDCAADPTCEPETICDDGIDNDLDTAVDCADAVCAGNIACQGIDSDGDTVPNASDCAPLDPGGLREPGRAAHVRPVVSLRAGRVGRIDNRRLARAAKLAAAPQAPAAGLVLHASLGAIVAEG